MTKRIQKPFTVLLLLAASTSLGQQIAGKRASAPTYTGTAVTGGKLVKHVNPILPPEVTAKALAEGVVVTLTIDKQGIPKDLCVTKGDSVLAKAALEALRQWRWRPYKLNGEAVEVESNVYIGWEPSRN